MEGITNGTGLLFILFVILVLGWVLTLGVNAMSKQATNWQAEIWARQHEHRD